MKKYGGNEARQAFAAGTLGIYIDSSSYLTRMIEGAAYTYEPATGRSTKLPRRPELADQEPYITVTQKQERGALRDKLFLMMP